MLEKYLKIAKKRLSLWRGLFLFILYLSVFEAHDIGGWMFIYTLLFLGIVVLLCGDTRNEQICEIRNFFNKYQYELILILVIWFFIKEFVISIIENEVLSYLIFLLFIGIVVFIAVIIFNHWKKKK